MRTWTIVVALLKLSRMINGSILPQPKIIGGKEVPYGKWPFIAFTAGQSLCAATLIHSDVLLSAAHCNQAFDEGVFIGGIYLNEIDGTFHAVADRLVHPNYSGDELYEPINDIMLVKIAIPSTETPVTLARFSGQPAEGSVVTVAGYGLTTEGGDVSDTLLETQMFVSNTDDCLYLYELDASISPKIFCTLEDNRDTCQGDSGGPLLSKDGVQVGIISFGYGCAVPGVPSVNTKVSTYADWIRSGICDLTEYPPSYCETAPETTESPTESPIIVIPIPANPTIESTISPITMEPTPYPTLAPTRKPVTTRPTPLPTPSPETYQPTTNAPTLNMTTTEPTLSPTTQQPTSLAPTQIPTSMTPSVTPSSLPTSQPSGAPTSIPSSAPSSITKTPINDSFSSITDPNSPEGKPPVAESFSSQSFRPPTIFSLLSLTSVVVFSWT